MLRINGISLQQSKPMYFSKSRGCEIPISDMHDQHILFAIRQKIGDSFVSLLNKFQFDCYQDLHSFVFTTLMSDLCNEDETLRELLKEADKRGL